MLPNATSSVTRAVAEETNLRTASRYPVNALLPFDLMGPIIPIQMELYKQEMGFGPWDE